MTEIRNPKYKEKYRKRKETVYPWYLRNATVRKIYLKVKHVLSLHLKDIKFLLSWQIYITRTIVGFFAIGYLLEIAWKILFGTISSWYLTGPIIFIMLFDAIFKFVNPYWHGVIMRGKYYQWRPLTRTYKSQFNTFYFISSSFFILFLFFYFDISPLYSFVFFNLVYIIIGIYF
jgi:hypothetical protein